LLFPSPLYLKKQSHVWFPFPFCFMFSFSSFSFVRSSLPSIYKQEKKEPPLLCPIVVQGGNGLPYLCKVRWPAVCRAWCPSLLFITLAGYVGAWAVVSFMQVGGR
jgi:hypothetical protein